MNSKTALKIYLSAALLEGLVSLLLLISIPSDSNNAWLFGFSRSRALLLLMMVFVVLILSITVIKAWRDKIWLENVAQLVEKWLRRERLTSVVLAGAVACFLAGAYIIVAPQFTTDSFAEGYLSRLGPLVFWFSAVCAQTILYIRFRNSESWNLYAQTRSWKKLSNLILIGGIAFAIWTPRVTAMDRYSTPDERLWVFRSENFYEALLQKDFASTFQAAHPGVMTMWAGTLGILQREIDFPEPFQPAKDFRKGAPLFAGRMYMVIANTLTLTLAFVFARRLFGTLAAVTGFLLIAFDPFHTALTVLLHLDGLLSNFMLLSTLAFLSYLQGHRTLDLVVSGIAAGLSWLTKSPGLFLVPFAGLLGTLEFWRQYSLKKEENLVRSILTFARPMVLWGIIGVAVFFILWPAMWVDPVGAVSNIFGKAQEYASGGHSHPIYYRGEIYENGNIGFLSWFYPVTYLWRTTPVVLFGLLGAALSLALKDRSPIPAKTRQTAIGLLLFALFFWIFINTGGKKFDRYLLPVYAPLDLVAGLGMVGVFTGLIGNRIRMRSGSSLRHYGVITLLAAALLLQLGGTLRTYPYYLSYYNPVLGGPAKAPEVMMIGWGEGLDQAAQYLNEKPNAERLKAYSWYKSVFSIFFSGQTFDIPAQGLSEEEFEEILAVDYVVVYIHQWQRGIPERLLDYLGDKEPEHSVWLNGLEYARIYKIQ